MAASQTLLQIHIFVLTRVAIFRSARLRHQAESEPRRAQRRRGLAAGGAGPGAPRNLAARAPGGRRRGVQFSL